MIEALILLGVFVVLVIIFGSNRDNSSTENQETLQKSLRRQRELMGETEARDDERWNKMSDLEKANWYLKNLHNDAPADVREDFEKLVQVAEDIAELKKKDLSRKKKTKAKGRLTKSKSGGKNKRK